ncbi:MAG: tetratricopeptide repeat protein [Moorea sp. SIO2B7]|nr:tetratricopeptide repeat protein [Moorena sp. SIO2B7]
MKVSQQKHNTWIYVVLVLMLLALVGFSVLPFVDSIVEFNQSPAKTASAPTNTISSETPEQLETEAKGYELVLQRESDNPTALQGLLEVRLKQGDLKGAIIPLEKLAKLNSQETDYMILLAQAKQQISDYEGAARGYRAVLASHPGDMNALQGMVSLLLQQNRPEAAIGLLQDTLKTAAQPDSEQSTSTRSKTILQLGH